MKSTQRTTWTQTVAAACGALVLLTATPAIAQEYGAPPRYAPGQLENLVSRIALYPDPLLAQVLAASTFPDQIPEAARWADENRNAGGGGLANAISQANLPFDPSVQALIPFPTILDMMASDPNWTNQLGDAVLAQRPDVMDAIQVMRRRAENYGYLRSNDRIRVVATSAAVEILPYDPGFVCVPVYDPFVVYAPPRPGFFVGTAIGFRSGFAIGSAFGGWGWGGGFNWYNHAVIVNNAPWGRTWYNRGSYVHNWGNWNGGRWQNTYVNRNVTVNNVNITRENINRNVNNETFYRNQNGNRYNNAYTAQPVYRGSQSNPVPPNRAYSNGYSNNSGYANSGSTNSGYSAQSAYRGGQSYSAPADRGYSNRYRTNSDFNAQNSYRGGQQAPVTVNRGFERQAATPAIHPAESGHSEQNSRGWSHEMHGGGRR